MQNITRFTKTTQNKKQNKECYWKDVGILSKIYLPHFNFIVILFNLVWMYLILN